MKSMLISHLMTTTALCTTVAHLVPTRDPNALRDSLMQTVKGMLREVANG